MKFEREIASLMEGAGLVRNQRALRQFQEQPVVETIRLTGDDEDRIMVSQILESLHMTFPLEPEGM